MAWIVVDRFSGAPVGELLGDSQLAIASAASNKYRRLLSDNRHSERQQRNKGTSCFQACSAHVSSACEGCGREFEVLGAIGNGSGNVETGIVTAGIPRVHVNSPDNCAADLATLGAGLKRKVDVKPQV